MASENEFKQFHVENYTYDYSDDLIKIINLHLDNILCNGDSKENVLVYEFCIPNSILCKVLMYYFQ